MLSSSSWLRRQALQRPDRTALRGRLSCGGTRAKAAEGSEELRRRPQSSPWQVRARPTSSPPCALSLGSYLLEDIISVDSTTPCQGGQSAAARRYNLLPACGHKTLPMELQRRWAGTAHGPTCLLEPSLAACGDLSSPPDHTLQQGSH